MADEKDIQTPAESESQKAEQESVAQEATPEEATPEEATPEEATPEEATPDAADPNSAAAEGEAAEVSGEESKVADGADKPEGDAEADMMAMLEDLPSEEQQANVDDINFSDAEVSKAEFQQLSEPAGDPEGRNIDLLMDVNLPISIELGRTKMSISDILALGPGSVVELNKLAGEPVDLLVNQKVVAKGEVVVIDENFGVRVTQLMTPEERLKSLGEES